MTALLSFFSKPIENQKDGRQQMNRVLDSTICALITVAGLFVLSADGFGQQVSIMHIYTCKHVTC